MILVTGLPMTRKPHDPLADRFARGRIDEAQFLAGREFQKHFAIADKRRPAASPSQVPIFMATHNSLF